MPQAASSGQPWVEEIDVSRWASPDENQVLAPLFDDWEPHKPTEYCERRCFISRTIASAARGLPHYSEPLFSGIMPPRPDLFKEVFKPLQSLSSSQDSQASINSTRPLNITKVADVSSSEAENALPPTKALQIPHRRVFFSPAEVRYNQATNLAIWIGTFMHRRITATAREDWVARSGRTPDTLVRTLVADPIRDLCLKFMSKGESYIRSPPTIFLALWYISHLLEDVKGPVCSGATTVEVIYQMFVVGSMLADKTLNDSRKRSPALNDSRKHSSALNDSRRSVAWGEVSGIDVSTLNKLERNALRALHYRLHLPCNAWHTWLENLRDYHISLILEFDTADYTSPFRHILDLIERSLRDIPLSDWCSYRPSGYDANVVVNHHHIELHHPRPKRPPPSWLRHADNILLNHDS